MSIHPAPEGPLDQLFRSGFDDAGVDGGGLSVVTKTGERETLYVSDPVAAEVERLQFTLGEGPCVDATNSGTPVMVADVGDATDPANDRWPVFVGEVARSGVRAVFALPIRMGAISLGAVDLYRLTPGNLSRRQLSSALSTVEAAGAAVLDGLELSMDPRSTPTSMIVHQAAGMVMVQLDCSIDEALVRLRATAFTEGVAVNRLAADVVRRHRRLTKEE